MSERIDVTINKAARMHRDDMPPPSIDIHIDVEVPEFSGDGWQERCAHFYREQGAKLEAVLYATLPGGTYSNLLERMLRRRASHFRVSFAEANKEVGVDAAEQERMGI